MLKTDSLFSVQSRNETPHVFHCSLAWNTIFLESKFFESILNGSRKRHSQTIGFL